ncbi:MAG TPA: hypothetical protein VH188_05720 [Chthoniobacterales bacterium]|jgi:hypothetical protein|nr:hypothetical protein [Chthoniobacterales bacterium]
MAADLQAGAPPSPPVDRGSRAIRQIVIRGSLLLLPLLPVFYLLYLINQCGVNVPYADEFTLAPLLLKAHDHTLTLSDLFSQHNEHRYVFTRLLFIAINFCSRGDVRAEMFFSVFLVFLTGTILWWLLRKTIPHSAGSRTFALCLFSLLLFSPVQAENWVWGFQTPLFFCNLLLTCAIAVAFSNLELKRKFVLCAAIAFIASFSFGGGVVLWLVTFPCALLGHREKSVSWRWGWFAFWCALAAASITLYFFHYVKPPYHPPIAAAKKPLEYYRYVAGFLGAHLSRASRLEPITQAVAIGTGLLALYLGGAIYCLRRFKDSSLLNRLLPWLALGGYALINGALAALARIGFGVHQALDSRYTSFSLFISVAVIALFIIAKEDLPKRWTNGRAALVFMRGETALVTLFGILTLLASSWGRESMLASKKTRLLGKGALLFTNVMDSGAIHDQCLGANAPDARMFANQLDSIGLMHPAMIKSAEIRKLKTVSKPAGFLDAISVSGQSCTVIGWGVLPKTRGSAYCVVLSYDDPEKGPIAFRMADEILGRPDVAAALESPEASDSGWACHFERSAVPSGDHLLTAWAFDAERAVLYRLDTPQILH